MQIRARLGISADGYVTTPGGWPAMTADPAFRSGESHAARTVGTGAGAGSGSAQCHGGTDPLPEVTPAGDVLYPPAGGRLCGAACRRIGTNGRNDIRRPGTVPAPWRAGAGTAPDDTDYPPSRGKHRSPPTDA
jgi:hypothetical protein